MSALRNATATQSSKAASKEGGSDDAGEFQELKVVVQCLRKLAVLTVKDLLSKEAETKETRLLVMETAATTPPVAGETSLLDHPLPREVTVGMVCSRTLSQADGSLFPHKIRGKVSDGEGGFYIAAMYAIVQASSSWQVVRAALSAGVAGAF